MKRYTAAIKTPPVMCSSGRRCTLRAYLAFDIVEGDGGEALNADLSRTIQGMLGYTGCESIGNCDDGRKPPSLSPRWGLASPADRVDGISKKSSDYMR